MEETNTPETDKCVEDNKRLKFLQESNWIADGMDTAASHHIFAHPRVVEIINLQDDGAGKAKKYQVKQIRALVEKYSL